VRRALILVLICLVLVVAGAATVWAAPTTTTSSTTTPTTSVGSTTTEPEYVSLPVVISPTTVRPGGTITVQGNCATPYNLLVITPSSGSGVLVQQQLNFGPNGATVQIPSTAAAGTYVLVVICEEEPDMQAASELGPATFTVAGDPIATTPAATAVTATPTLTG
jgi:hypothetical protein